MSLKPLGDRVVVQFEETEEKTAGGFVLAANHQEATKVASILAVGQGIRTLNGDLVAPSVVVGDKILVENGVGISAKDGDQKVTIIRESDILAILG